MYTIRAFCYRKKRKMLGMFNFVNFVTNESYFDPIWFEREVAGQWVSFFSHHRINLKKEWTMDEPSNLRPHPVTTHRVPSVSAICPGCGMQATSMCGLRRAGFTKRTRAMSLASDKLLNWGWTMTWLTSSSSYGSCSVVTLTSYSPRRTFKTELMLVAAKLQSYNKHLNQNGKELRRLIRRRLVIQLGNFVRKQRWRPGNVSAGNLRRFIDHRNVGLLITG